MPEAPWTIERIMIPTLKEIKALCPDLDENLAQEHLSRLGERYFSRFAEKEICRHLEAFGRLSRESPVETLLETRRDGTVECTVLAFDYPYEFSMITGVLAGLGFNIVSGDVFTYARAEKRPGRGAQKRRSRGARQVEDTRERRKIIDHFSGLLEPGLSFKQWSLTLKDTMAQIIGLLEKGDEKSMKEAKHRVNEMVVKELAMLQKDTPPILYPVTIEIQNDAGPFTRLKVVSEDTPAFLYALGNALSLHGVLIEHVKIRTIHGRIEDEIDLVDSRGGPIEDQDVLDRIKLSVLLTKQFTYFLSKAPDPYSALSRFEQLLGDVIKMPERGRWLELFSNPHMLQDLARLLGTSDFLWEDFIRLQYETLLPMLQPRVKGRRFSGSVETIEERLENFLEGASSPEEQRRRLNEFKDREIFLIDLDHILNQGTPLRQFGLHLSSLADAVVRTAAKLAFKHLAGRFGVPRTVGGLAAKYAVFGLGKLGGRELGYASDIELLFVYSDNGRTDGKEPIDNSEFFERLVKETRQFIRAKREGIFQIDLRLRPHGNAGPLACSLENFCRYYGPEGQAHSYERLALVRMRAIGGDPELGRRVERLRDEIIYFSRSIEIDDLRRLRERQFKEKSEAGKINAKFSPGGLVDLEYSVQILQVMYGARSAALRTPGIRDALNALAEMEVLPPEEVPHLMDAYEFLRVLINGLRMLRGSAKDLFLPPADSDEYEHLARRMGYEGRGGLGAAQQLHIDFETHTAKVRTFAGRFIGKGAAPGYSQRNIADLIFLEDASEELKKDVLSHLGFQEFRKAYTNLMNLAGEGSQRNTFAKLAVLAGDILQQKPDPDMALNNWERFKRALTSPEFHYNLMLSQPMRLEILLGLFSTSQFLADTLIRNPGFLDWVVIPENLNRPRDKKVLEDELRKAANYSNDHREWLNKLRRFRRREILRIGTRDICLGVPTREVMEELSILAEAFAQVVLENIWTRMREEGRISPEMDGLENRFCVMALGKLGARELNYSSDIDLMGICRIPEGHKPGGDAGHFSRVVFARAMEQLRSDLSSHTEEGYAYRVDLRLRPFGDSGELVSTVPALIRYYQKMASLWEVQASLKMRPIAGNLQLGYDLMRKLRALIMESGDRGAIVESIQRMRRLGAGKVQHALRPGWDVKEGHGGLRDIEFLVQGLQLIHAPDNPSLIEGNTLIALQALSDAGVLPGTVADQLMEDYDFLRRTEHYLQILEDRQIHTIPKDRQELTRLAKKMLGRKATAETFMERLEECINRVRESYERYLVKD